MSVIGRIFSAFSARTFLASRFFECSSSKTDKAAVLAAKNTSCASLNSFHNFCSSFLSRIGADFHLAIRFLNLFAVSFHSLESAIALAWVTISDLIFDASFLPDSRVAKYCLLVLSKAERAALNLFQRACSSDFAP